MSAGVARVVAAISDANNRYRDPSSSPREKLEALWEIGDSLVKLGVTKPHAIGWAVQRETKGLIKRPTVFRSHKIRIIWDTKSALLRDIGSISHLSAMREMLPLIDPRQVVRKQVSEDVLRELYERACSDSPREFRTYVSRLKQRFAHGRLGKQLNRAKHLPALRETVVAFKVLQKHLLDLATAEDVTERDAFRDEIPTAEVLAFSNMCLSLTTKDNCRLYRRGGPGASSSPNRQFRLLYDKFRAVLDKRSDVERARLRRVISADALAEMSDMLSSLQTEEALSDFKARKRMSIDL